VVRTSQALDAASRTLLTEVDIANPGMTLLSGMYAQVHVHLEHRAPALIVPSTALIVRASGTQVAVLDATWPGQPATAHFVPVTVGRDFGGTIEIQSGLNEGAGVVANPGADLVDGMHVRIAPPSLSSAAAGR
jgi:multidrug efflux pump subunit AcrA (membrane-fusion protein)